jgi:hypothetical protein
MTTAVMEDKGTEDQVAEYNGKGMMVARDAEGSGVAMMAARVEDSGVRQRRQWQMTMVVDDDGSG